MAAPTATVPPELRAHRPGPPWAQRIAIAGLVVFLLAGVLGAFGLTSQEVTDEVRGLRLEVVVPHTTRAGLPLRVEWRLTSTDGPLPQEVQLRSRAAWFDLTDLHGLWPAPEEEWQDGDWVIWTFRPPAGSRELLLGLDARVQVDVQGREAGATEVVADGRPGPAVSWTTTIWP